MSRLPVVAVLGRPNVGKSTLVNRILRRRLAVVEEKPGVTRDRKEFVAEVAGREFVVVDTGGWELSPVGDLTAGIREQAEVALGGADLVIFVADARTSVSDDDAGVARLLQRAEIPYLFVANKVDSPGAVPDTSQLWSLGLGEPRPISALNGHGVADLLEAVASRLPAADDEAAARPPLPTLAIIGRPNVGKSTLLNQLAGEDRVLVSPEPGTTRDAIDAVVEMDGQQFRVVDTAGIRRAAKVDEATEFYSVLRARQALRAADVALLVVDSHDGVTHQEQRLAEEIADSGTGLVVLLNKWDDVDPEEKEITEDGVADRLAFVGWAPVLRVSARTGARLHRLAAAARVVLEARRIRISTPELNRLIRSWQEAHPAPTRKGRRARVIYAVQVGTEPPTIILFVRGGELAPEYVRFLENRLRREFDFTGSPLRLVARRRRGAPPVSEHDRFRAAAADARRGGPERHRKRLADQGKLPVRERVASLCDEGSFVEDGLLANVLADELAADGVVTGRGQVDGRPVVVIANDPTVKAGSWGARTVEKIIRALEGAYEELLPVFYLVDSAGARITDQVDLFPGRRGAGLIFYNQVRLSGRVPQVCCLFGPSAAGGAYIPSFCDVVVMVEGRASMYLGSPRMAEMVVGEKTTLEEMGGARMHCTVSGCGDALVNTDEEAIAWAQAYFANMADHYQTAPAPIVSTPPGEADLDAVVPDDPWRGYDMRDLLRGIFDAGSLFEVKELYARELITAFARLEGRVVGLVASQPKHLGGVLFVDSADKAARFIWLCDAFNVPLLFFADVPGFMIGTKVEQEGIIRSGAKMLTAVAEATVPRISVIVRKAYGAGLYAFSGPGLRPDATLALPSAEIAVMGPEAAVNAVYFNKIQELPEKERADFVAARRAEYADDVDLLHLAAELVIDAVVQPQDLRAELAARLRYAKRRDREFSGRRHGVPPV